MPNEFIAGEIYVTVNGFDGNGIIIAEEGPIPICTGCEWETSTCYGICYGPRWAWKAFHVQMLPVVGSTGSGSNTMTFLSTINDVTGQPYYQYISENQWILMDPAFQIYYNASPTWPYQGNKTIQLTDVKVEDEIRDAENNVLTGTVYGINKYLGPWAQDPTPVVTAENIAVEPSTTCNEPIGTMVDILNTNTFSSWFFDGNPLFCGVGSVGVPSFDHEGDEVEFLNNCWTELEAWLEATDGSFAEALELFDCKDGDGGGFDWPENVALVNIMPYENPNGEVQVLKKEDLYLPNGEFVSPQITIDEGLYMIGVQFKDASYLTLWFDSVKSRVWNIPYSELLEANIFPVPIQDDEFTLSMTAKAKLKFDYVLYDLNGEELFRRNFVIPKDHSREQIIKIHNGIPSGQLVNKFYFEDGSVLEFQTIK
ncbi:MAG: hypothetical protein WDZ35_02835 [Crocinitomicaceae bacterium]